MAEELWWMSQAAAQTLPAKGRRAAPDDVWDRVRDDYLSGLSAQQCCDRHGVGRSALRARARAEGWRRVDQPWAAPAGLEADDEGVELENEVQGDLAKVCHRQLVHIARRRMMRAILHGEAAAALRWRRVALTLEVEQEQIEAAARYAANRLAQGARSAQPDSSDLSDTSPPDSGSGGDPPTGPSPLAGD